MTREDLLVSLTAMQVNIQQLISTQKRRDAIRSQYIRYAPLKESMPEKLKLGKKQLLTALVTYIILQVLIFWPIWVLFRLITYPMGLPIADADFQTFYRIICVPACLVLTIFMAKIYNKWARRRNKIIEEMNYRIDQKNRPLMEAEVKIIEEMKALHAEFRRLTAGWYPENYASLHHIESFLHYIRNYEADNIKEAIACYKADVHRNRLEQEQRAMREGQAEIVRQQKFGNILAMGNIIMQAGIQQEIRQGNNMLNNINNKLR